MILPGPALSTFSSYSTHPLSSPNQINSTHTQTTNTTVCSAPLSLSCLAVLHHGVEALQTGHSRHALPKVTSLAGASYEGVIK